MTDTNTVGPVRIDLGPCTCATPDVHTSDWVEIFRHAPYQMGLAALESIAQSNTPIELGVALRQVYVVWGVTGWNLIDGAGKPINVTRETIAQQLMSEWGDRNVAVIEACARQFNDEVMLPLQTAASRQLSSGLTEASTSPNRASRRETAKHSRPSSPTSLADGSTSAVLDG